jgi:hypothetical protein
MTHYFRICTVGLGMVRPSDEGCDPHVFLGRRLGSRKVQLVTVGEKKTRSRRLKTCVLSFTVDALIQVTDCKRTRRVVQCMSNG